MGTTLRVAGGWVRDKLVGQVQGSHQRKLKKVNKMDIDIALDNCMGGDFAAKLNRYLGKVGGWWAGVGFVTLFMERYGCIKVLFYICFGGVLGYGLSIQMQHRYE